MPCGMKIRFCQKKCISSSAHLLRLIEDEGIDAVFIQGQYILLNLAFSLDTRMHFNHWLKNTLFSFFSSLLIWSTWLVPTTTTTTTNNIGEFHRHGLHNQRKNCSRCSVFQLLAFFELSFIASSPSSSSPSSLTSRELELVRCPGGFSLFFLHQRNQLIWKGNDYLLCRWILLNFIIC